jgi:ATP-dependent DNA helicase DinG
MTDLDHLFSTDGPLAQEISGYARRDGQVALAQAVKRVLGDCPSVLVAEAPTGVGKSAAVLAALLTSEPIYTEEGSARPSMIMTSTVALQEQYMRKDVPIMKRAIGSKKSVRILKGRTHYVCRQKLDVEQRKRDEVVLDIAEWATKSNGDRSSLPFDVDNATWSKVAASGRECLGEDCPYQEECFHRIARSVALSADIIVANYHSAFVPAPGFDGGLVVDKCGHVVCDEAHDLPKTARSIFGKSINKYDIRWLASTLSDVRPMLVGDVPHGNELIDQGAAFFNSLLVLLEERGVDTLRIQRPGLVRTQGLAQSLAQIINELEAMSGGGLSMPPQVKAKLNRLLEVCLEYQSMIIDASILDDDRMVYWVQHDRMGANGDPVVSLRRAPFRVAYLLNRHLFSREGSTILMSATLRSSNGFQFIRAEVGAPPETVELLVSSPFSLATQGALVIPSTVRLPPKPDAENDYKLLYKKEVAVACGRLILAMGGRTLALFTSWYALNDTYEMLVRLEKMRPFKFLKQGDAPTPTLIKEFTEDETSVLFGVATMWQGVDVPGDALKGVFISKIPFPVPSEPINEAMNEWLDTEYGKGSSFALWSLPLATTALQQGMGRLIRSVGDTGVVVIADRRLTTYAYGKRIMSALPGFGRFSDIDQAKKVLPKIFLQGESHG